MKIINKYNYKLPLILLIFISSCSTHSYRYKISGMMRAKVKQGDFFQGYSHKEVLNSCIAYTDTINGSNVDSIWYYNTNGKKITILSPYIVENIN